MSALFWKSEPRATTDDGLTPERINVYLLSPSAVAGDALQQELATVLDADELARWRKLAFAADRHAFLVSHALVRFALSRYANVPPAAWTFTANRFGRPEIADPQAGRGLRFNLSHTAGLVALAIGRQRDVGVDVENLTRELPHEAAATVLSPAELDRLNDLPQSQRQERLLTLWTLKEAYAKGRGLGLSLPLRQFSFEIADTLAVTIAAEAGADPGRWLFELHRPSPIHRLALAYDAARFGKADVRLETLVQPLAG